MAELNFNFLNSQDDSNLVPAILNTALVWLDDSTFVTSGNDITRWTNKGTGGAVYDMNGLTSGTLLPQLSSFKGLSIADLSLSPNADRKYFRPTVTQLINQPMTFISVAALRVVSTGVIRVLFHTTTGQAATSCFMSASTTDSYLLGSPTIIASPNSLTDVAPHVNVGVINSPNSRIIITDIHDEIGDSGSNNYTYGTIGGNLNTQQNWDGWVGEFIIFDSVLNDDDLALVITYLRNKFNF